MAQFHRYYGSLSFNSPILWLPMPDFAIQFPSRAPSPGYSETKSAVPRKRISENNPRQTSEIYTQAHPATHRGSVTSRQSPSDITAGAQVGGRGAQDALTRTPLSKWNTIIVKKKMNIVSANKYKAYNGLHKQLASTAHSTQAQSGDTRHDAIPHIRKSEIARARLTPRGAVTNDRASPQTATVHSMNKRSGKQTHAPSEDDVLGDPSEHMRRLKSQQQTRHGRVL